VLRRRQLKLFPQYSQSSVDFVQYAASAVCRGELYRSEKNFLVQGRISCPPGSSHPKVVKGDCPAGIPPDKSRRCPSHDPNCGCHGPIMSKGMVGWAGGSAGPDVSSAHSNLIRIAAARLHADRSVLGLCPRSFSYTRRT
jgi:hypothetical protein